MYYLTILLCILLECSTVALQDYEIFNLLFVLSLRDVNSHLLQLFAFINRLAYN